MGIFKPGEERKIPNMSLIFHHACGSVAQSPRVMAMEKRREEGMEQRKRKGGGGRRVNSAWLSSPEWCPQWFTALCQAAASFVRGVLRGERRTERARDNTPHNSAEAGNTSSLYRYCSHWQHVQSLWIRLLAWTQPWVQWGISMMSCYSSVLWQWTIQYLRPEAHDMPYPYCKHIPTTILINLIC